MSQNDLILRHLRHRPITALEAFELYGCLRLAARIADLREKGYKINSVLVNTGEKRYARYFLEK